VFAPPKVVPDEDTTTLEMLGMSVVDPSPPTPGLYDAAIPQLPTDFFKMHMMPPTPMPLFIPPPSASARSPTLLLSEIHQSLNRHILALPDGSLTDNLEDFLGLLPILVGGFFALKREVDLLGTQMYMVLYQ
jgi:hypothetical protein